MVTTGYYINVFKPAYVDKHGTEICLPDVYVVLNEPNDEPTPEEVTKIEEAISKIDPCDAALSVKHIKENRRRKRATDLEKQCRHYIVVPLALRWEMKDER